SHLTWAWLCQSFMAVLLPHRAFLTEDRLTTTLGTAEPLGVSPPEAVDLFLIKGFGTDARVPALTSSKQSSETLTGTARNSGTNVDKADRSHSVPPART